MLFARSLSFKSNQIKFNCYYINANAPVFTLHVVCMFARTNAHFTCYARTHTSTHAHTHVHTHTRLVSELTNLSRLLFWHISIQARVFAAHCSTAGGTSAQNAASKANGIVQRKILCPNRRHRQHILHCENLRTTCFKLHPHRRRHQRSRTRAPCNLKHPGWLAAHGSKLLLSTCKVDVLATGSDRTRIKLY